MCESDFDSRLLDEPDSCPFPTWILADPAATSSSQDARALPEAAAIRLSLGVRGEGFLTEIPADPAEHRHDPTSPKSGSPAVV